MQIEELRGDMNAREAVTREYERIHGDIQVLRMEVMRSGDSGLNMPVAMKRLVSNAQTRFDCGPMRRPAPTEAFGPLDIVRKVEVSIGFGVWSDLQVWVAIAARSPRLPCGPAWHVVFVALSASYVGKAVQAHREGAK